MIDFFDFCYKFWSKGGVVNLLLLFAAPHLLDDPGKLSHVRINIIRAGCFCAGREMVVADV